MATPDIFYKEAMEHCQTYNSRLMAERRVRLPYLDSQTRVAQNECFLWFEKRHRAPGLGINQVYSYPSKRWKKRPRFNPLPQFDIPETTLINENSNDSNMNAIAAAILEEEPEGSRTSNLGGHDDDVVDEEDDEYDVRSRKRPKRGQKPAVNKPRWNETQEERTFTCEYCGKKYKNRPGLNYHLHHMHQDELDVDDEYTPTGRLTPSSIISEDRHSSSSRTSAIQAQKAVAAAVDVSDSDGMETRPRRKRPVATMNDYCDFCLGDAGENKKTGESEELISCSDCGRSGHPTCLQFTDIMTMNVKKYSWQCIECKSCHVCGTSDNDEQLLFCDDCDRGYHMYCLNPPMDQPPEGSWICDLCESDRKEREKGTDKTLNL